MDDHIDEIFSWLCKGACEWYTAGKLPTCDVMTKEMDKYINELDVLSQFVEDRCERGVDFRLSPSEAYQEFIGWCAEGDIKGSSQQEFSRGLKKRGFDQKRTKKEGRFYAGLRMCRNEVEDPRRHLPEIIKELSFMDG
jgi:putative DNA primase/helicase